MDDPESITAIDFNENQTKLMQLKILAMSELHYDEYVGFLGLLPFDRRVSLLEKLSGKMEPDLKAYWLNRKNKINAGILYQGRFEKYFK